MITKQIIDAIRREFQDKKIVLLPEDEPTEVVVELSRTDKESVAIAFIEKSKPHYHNELTERYQVEEGVLFLRVGGFEFVVQSGQAVVISPGMEHCAMGRGVTRVRVISSPPWTPEDHILV